MNISKIFHRISRFFSDENLTKKAYLNIITAALSFVVRLLVAFIITPLMVTGLGDFVYGLWQIINRLVGYITPASGQPTEALLWVISKQQTSKDYDLKRKYFSSSVIVWLIFLPFMLTVGAIIAWFSPQWIDVPLEYYGLVRITALLMTLMIALRVFSELPQSVLRGENLGYKRIGLTIFLTILSGVATWLALYFDTGIIGVTVAALITTVFNGLLYLWLARVYVQWFGVVKPPAQMVQEFLKLSGWFMGWGLVWTSMIATDVVLLGILASVELVTIYTLTKYVPELLISIIQILISGITPGLGGIIGMGDFEKASKLRGEMLTISWLVAAAVGTTVMMWNRTFMNLWLGGDKYAGSAATLLIIIATIQFILIINDAVIIDITLKLNRKVILGGLSVLLTIAASALFMHVMQNKIVGLSLGLISGRLLLSIGYPLIVGNSLKISWLSQLNGIIRPAFTTGILLASTYALEKVLPSSQYSGLSGWVLFFGSAGLTFCFISLITMFLGLNKKQRLSLINRLRMVIGMTPVV